MILLFCGVLVRVVDLKVFLSCFDVKSCVRSFVVTFVIGLLVFFAFAKETSNRHLSLFKPFVPNERKHRKPCTPTFYNLKS